MTEFQMIIYFKNGQTASEQIHKHFEEKGYIGDKGKVLDKPHADIK